MVYIRNLSPTALQATSSNLGFYALTVFACKKYLQNYSQKKGLIFCLRRRISKDAGVKVLFNPVREKAHYGNLITCGSVWTCPVCSARISEQRRQELKLAMTNWRKQVGSVYLLTLTNPHYCGDNLKQLLEGQRRLLNIFLV